MKKGIKKTILIILSLVLVFSVFGCDSSDVNDVIDNAFENYKNMNSTETGEYKNFKSINVDSSYLGYGYDVINDPYMDKNTINFSAPIIDMDKIENAKLKMIKENTGDVAEFEGSSMEELYQSYAVSLNVYGKVGKMFSGGLKFDYSGSSNEKTYWHFYKNIYSIKTFNIYMTNTVNEIKNMLSQEFKNDLISMNAEDLFAKYGTHLIKEAVMGGRMEISSTYSSTSSNITSDVDLAVNAHIKFLKSASLNMESSASYEAALSNENVQVSTKIKQYGGALVDTHNREALASNYSKWVESFDQSLEYAALSGVVGENSLLGLWDLLPDGYTSRANELKNKFIELSGDAYDELCEQFKLKAVVPDDPDDEPDDTEWTTLEYMLQRKSSVDGAQYNPNNPITDEGTTSIHDGYEIGKMFLYGCKEDGGKISIANKDDFSLKYNILMDINDLPRRDGVQSVKICSDEAVKVHGTNIDSTVGVGAYWVRVTYADDTQDEFKATDFMKGKSKDSYIELISSDQLNLEKQIKSIEIVVAYELYFGGPGFLGIWWHVYTNWRCEYTFTFAQ